MTASFIGGLQWSLLVCGGATVLLLILWIQRTRARYWHPVPRVATEVLLLHDPEALYGPRSNLQLSVGATRRPNVSGLGRCVGIRLRTEKNRCVRKGDLDHGKSLSLGGRLVAARLQRGRKGGACPDT